MLDAAYKALKQMFSPAFRALLWKAVGAAFVLVIVMAVLVHRGLVWLVEWGGASLEQSIGSPAGVPLWIVGWVLVIAAGFGVIAGAIFLMPAVTALVASLFVDRIAEQVEGLHYPVDPPGRAVPFARATLEGGKTAGLAVLVYLCAVPFLLVAGVGAVIFFLAAAFLLGREYFLLAAMRFRPVAEAKAMRKANAATIFVAGLFIAAFVSIPIVNLATPLFGMAFMVHMHKRLSGSKPQVLERIEKMP